MGYTVSNSARSGSSTMASAIRTPRRRPRPPATWPKYYSGGRSTERRRGPDEASMSAEATHWYQSKVDWWLALLLCLPPVASVAACVAVLAGGKASELPWAVAPVALVFGIY